MDLSPYLASVREGVTNAASLADENTQQVAQRLGTAIDSSTRLAMIRALSDAASTISADLAPASVEVRIVGGDPEFAVSVPNAPTEPTMIAATAEEPVESEELEPGAEDEPIARISLRLPASVKTKVDELADSDGISTNAWLQRAILDAINERRRPPHAPHPPIPPNPPTGVFGPDGPFGPNGVFGPGGVFGHGGPPGGKNRNREGRGRSHPGGQSVQGWVK